MNTLPTWLALLRDRLARETPANLPYTPGSTGSPLVCSVLHPGGKHDLGLIFLSKRSTGPPRGLLEIAVILRVSCLDLRDPAV